MDGDSAVQLLAKNEANNQSKSFIHMIWGNAAYHCGAAVKNSSHVRNAASAYNPVTCMLPTPEPDYASLGRVACKCHAQPLLSHSKAIPYRHSKLVAKKNLGKWYNFQS